MSKFLYETPNVDTKTFTDNKTSGGDGGSNFNFILLDKGAILKKIRAWKEHFFICALEIEMTNGSKRTLGKPRGKLSEFSFGNGERITELYFQASYVLDNLVTCDTYLPWKFDKLFEGENVVQLVNLIQMKTKYRNGLGAIKFKTNKNRSWSIKCSKICLQKRHNVEVGSGICCGIFGASDDIVNRLGFAMLRPIKKAVLRNLTYPRLGLEIAGGQPEQVAAQCFENESEVEQTFTLSGSKSVTTSQEWGLSTTISMQVITEVMAGVPKVAYTKAGLNLTVSATASFKTTTSTTETKQWSWPIKCPPKTQILASATMYSEEVDTNYEADMELELENGNKYSYKEKGVFKGQDVRYGNVSIKNLKTSSEQGVQHQGESSNTVVVTDL